MNIYAVSRDEFNKSRQNECEKKCFKVNSLDSNHVLIKVEFSTDNKDFSIIDSAVYQLIIKQYECNKYIRQNELLEIQEALEKVNGRDVETLSEIISSQYENISSSNDIVNFINNRDNFIFLYMTDEEELGYFIVRNLDGYKMPEETFDNINYCIDYKDVAERYLIDHDLDIVQIEDLLIDISRNKEDPLITKLQEKSIDARIIYDEANANYKEVQKEEEEEFE